MFSVCEQARPQMGQFRTWTILPQCHAVIRHGEFGFTLIWWNKQALHGKSICLFVWLLGIELSWINVLMLHTVPCPVRRCLPPDRRNWSSQYWLGKHLPAAVQTPERLPSAAALPLLYLQWIWNTVCSHWFLPGTVQLLVSSIKLSNRTHTRFFLTILNFPLSLQSYGVCVLGLDKLWLLIAIYGLSSSVFSSISLSLLCLPRWLCLVAGAIVHLILLVVLMALPLPPNKTEFLGPLLVISVLWGLGTALNKTGISSKW